MSVRALVLAGALLVAPLAQLSAQQAALFDELTVLYPDSDVAAGQTHFSGETPRGALVGVHALISGLPPHASVAWRVDARAVQAYRLIAVPVEQNTGLVSHTEAHTGVVNPHVVRRAPFSVFEVLEPVNTSTTANVDGVLALRFEVAVSATAPGGRHDHRVELRSGDWSSELSWGWSVQSVAVSRVTASSRGFTNWFSLERIARRHKLQKWSEPFFAMVGQYADLMARSRQNTVWVRWGDFMRQERGDFVVAQERLDRFLRIFLSRGFTRIEGGHLVRRHDGDWSSPRLDLVYTGADVASTAGRAQLSRLCAAIRGATAKLPPGIDYLQHVADEPTDTNAASYRDVAALLRQYLPRVRIFDATMSRAVIGAVDSWCPTVREFEEQRDFYEERRRSGDQVWVYTCTIPGGPWLNRLLDQERVRPVYLGWALVQNDLAGFLHWGLNHYRPGTDPFTQSVGSHEDGPPKYLPAGDTHVVYPGANGPYSGQRLEAHRIGMEDAQLLDQLRARDPVAARRIISGVLRAYNDYELDVAAYRRAKHELLRALQRE